jgi:hypothetical protein
MRASDSLGLELYIDADITRQRETGETMTNIRWFLALRLLRWGVRLCRTLCWERSWREDG